MDQHRKEGNKPIPRTLADNDEPDTVKIKNDRSELPTITVTCSRPKTTFDSAWNPGEPQLITELATRLTEITTLNVVLGMNIVASKPNAEGKDTTIVDPKTRPTPIYIQLNKRRK